MTVPVQNDSMFIINYYFLINKVFLNMASSACYFLLYVFLELSLYEDPSRNQSIEYCRKKEFHFETLKTNDAIKLLTYKDTP